MAQPPVRHPLINEGKVVVKGYQNRRGDRRVQVMMSHAFATSVGGRSAEHVEALIGELVRVLGATSDAPAAAPASPVPLPPTGVAPVLDLGDETADSRPVINLRQRRRN